MINKDTLLFGSFAKVAGNAGCRLFNTAFNYCNINAIYKSFSVNNIKEVVSAAKTLNFRGFAVSMPFKIEILKYVDKISKDVKKIGAANTIINTDGYLTAHNTDFLAAREFLSKYKDSFNHLYILGNGGYAAAVKYAAINLDFKFTIITRKNWNVITTIRDSLIYNCTPVMNDIDDSNIYIDCLVDTKTGKKLASIQAHHQFVLYTNREFPHEMLEYSSHLKMFNINKTVFKYISRYCADRKNVSFLDVGGQEGGRGNKIVGRSKKLGVDYVNMELDVKKETSKLIRGDICSCPQIPDESYDIVFSHNVFEHLKTPWTAAEECIRINKKGGLNIHITPFSWHYHPLPVDCFRYTHTGLIMLFENSGKVKNLLTGYSMRNRRGNRLGGSSKYIDGGLDRVPVDEMGGWRENWLTFYIGCRKK